MEDGTFRHGIPDFDQVRWFELYVLEGQLGRLVAFDIPERFTDGGKGFALSAGGGTGQDEENQYENRAQAAEGKLQGNVHSLQIQFNNIHFLALYHEPGHIVTDVTKNLQLVTW